MNIFRPKVDDDGEDDLDVDDVDAGLVARQDGLAAQVLLVEYPGLPHLLPGRPPQFLWLHWWDEHSQYAALPLTSGVDLSPLGCLLAR